jgi:hypothetical protein
MWDDNRNSGRLGPQSRQGGAPASQSLRGLPICPSMGDGRRRIVDGQVWLWHCRHPQHRQTTWVV